MNKNDFFYLGRISRSISSGKKFIAILDTDKPDDYDNLEVVFLNINNTYVPFFIETIDLTENKAVIKFEGDSTEGIEEIIIGSEMYLPAEALPKLKGNKFYFHEIKGFEMIDKKHGNLGVIEEVLDFQKQALFRVLKGEKEILVPVADDIIIKVDRKKKQILVQTPEGLIDIYL